MNVQARAFGKDWLGIRGPAPVAASAGKPYDPA